jgi:hypothetical protein
MAEAIFNDVFGRLTWSERYGCWLGAIEGPAGRQIDVAIYHPDTDVVAGLRTAREGLDWFGSHEEDARRRVAGQLLHVWNTAWREDDEPMDEDEFIEILDLLQITFIEDGSLLLCYDPADLFGGQVVEAEFDPDRRFRGAKLAG